MHSEWIRRISFFRRYLCFLGMLFYVFPYTWGARGLLFLPLAYTWCLPWSANRWIGCWSRYVFLNLYDFFYTICRSLIRTFFANNIRTRITDSYVGSTYYTNSYHLRLLTTYGLVYYGHEILWICMFTTYKLVYGREILWICMFSTIRIQFYELVCD